MAKLARAKSLRLGIVVDSPVVPHWVARAVEVARQQPRVSIDTLVILNGETGSTKPSPRRRPGLRGLYEVFDSWRFPLVLKALAPKHLEELGGWRKEQRSNPEGDRLREDLQSLGLDGVLWLSTRVSPRLFTGVSRYGVWCWRFGARNGTEAALSAVEPSFDAVLGDIRIIEVRLTAMLPDAQETVLAASLHNSVRFSKRRTEDSISWRAAQLLARAAGRLLTDGPGDEDFEDEAQTRTTHRKPVVVGLSQAAKLVSLGTRYVRHHLANARRINQWAMAFYRDPSGAPGPALVPGRYAELVPPRDRDWADPFPVRIGEVDWIFFEELEYARGVGHLSVAPLGQKHFTAKPEPIIMEKFHLSWPFVFEHEGAHYILPETAEERRIQLYRATRFPYEWVPDRVLMEGGTVVDPTLVHIDGIWWLFTCDLDGGNQPWTELHLFHSSSPFGPWIPHRRNPVVTAVSHARPAGRIYRQGDAWYRPAQDCSVDYGYALSVMRIDVLNRDEYRETKVAELQPTWGPRLCGVHTLNFTDALTLIDFRRRVWRRR